MSNIISELESLYELYGFELLQEDTDYLCFSHSAGYFCNVEILRLNHSVDVSHKQNEYSLVGYSVKITDFKSLNETHKNLFDGFFFQKNITKRLSQEYEKYCLQQANKLGCKQYRFVPCKFVGNQNIIETDVVSHIYNQIFKSGAQLIIVEAAAGYGKTSIAYELIKKLAEEPQGTVPIITELSKNRRAQIFKYVLLTEIDNKFRGLSSALVEKEIRNGNVPLIIDGFDELLSKAPPVSDAMGVENTENAQTMLSTIAQLLDADSQAKIVLTSRKSSIFTGELFTDWANRWLPACEITRIQIIAPNIFDWLTQDQLEVIEKNHIDLADISNPTLLTFLSSISPKEISVQFKSVDDILKKYFSILLEREKDRQSLLLSPSEQLNIMKNVAWSMLILDETAFTFEDIKDVLNMILANEQISEYMSRYEQTMGIEYVPNEDEFFGKLAHHALLDRIPNTCNLIGFINDFIFGYLLSENFIEQQPLSEDVLKNANEKYWDLMVTSFSSCSKAKRYKLYSLFADTKIKFSMAMQLNADILLMRCITKEYVSGYFDSFSFSDGVRIGQKTFSDCTFSNCIFDRCCINSDSFVKCKFYSCQFYNVKIVNSPVQNCQLIFSNCAGESEIRDAANQIPTPITINENEIFERKVLEQFWRPGSDHADRRRMFDTLFRGNNQQDFPCISDAIDRLCNRGFLLRQNNCIELDFAHMAEIKKLLGR